MEAYGDLGDQDKIENHSDKLFADWERRKRRGIKNSDLYFAVFAAFKWDYFRIVILTSLQAIMNIGGPFIIRPLVQFVKDGENAWSGWFNFWDTS